jgi:hypothetical protein
MPRLAVYLFVAVLAAHGLIHLLGPTVYLRISDLQGLPYKTTLLNGHLDVGVRGIAIFGGLWVLPAVGFVVSALALALGWDLWLPLAFAATCVSLALTALDWSVAYAGVVVNVVILALLALRGVLK